MPLKVMLDFPHGLGDVLQASVILKHLRVHRPDWQITFRCGRGKHSAVVGLCHRVVHDQEPRPEEKYDKEFCLGFFENLSHYHDRVNSKVTNNMREVFSVDWQPELSRYECLITPDNHLTAWNYLESIGCKRKAIRGDKCVYNSVLIHGHGNTSSSRKNLHDWQIKVLCDTIIRADRIPVILDWDHRSNLPDNKTIFNPPVGPGDIWGGFGSGDASVIAALIENSEAFIGIDSGPGKVASATSTPTLICWHGHHPMQFHDPAQNTLHLVPHDHRNMDPLKGSEEIFKCFERYYQYKTYENGQHGLVLEANRWLCELFGVPMEDQSIKYVVPNGIGDVMWVLHKIKSVNEKENAGKPIDIVLSGNPQNHIDYRSVSFLKRFPFVRSADVVDVPVLRDKENVSDEKGRYRYEPDGLQGNHYFLCPNTVLERGDRLETWMPEHSIDWDVIKEFDWSGTEKGTRIGKDLGKFAAIYLGPESGNVDEGHNWGFQWEPHEWVKLCLKLKYRGCKIALIGADYDRSYWERYVKDGNSDDWVDLIGQFEIGECFALLKESRCLISYQCGLAICHHYFGGNVVTWWRASGDSIHPRRFISFSEDMRTSWTNPEYHDNYVGCIYKRESVEDIVAKIDEKGWVK